MKHYRIMGNYRGQTEEIDCAETVREARYLQGEYQQAYGSSWVVWVEVQTFDQTGTLDECYPLMNTQQLAKHCPKAFQALPECYQADDCLYFWEQGGVLYARPAEGQEGVLGFWISKYVPETCAWKSNVAWNKSYL